MAAVQSCLYSTSSRLSARRFARKYPCFTSQHTHHFVSRNSSELCAAQTSHGATDTALSRRCLFQLAIAAACIPSIATGAASAQVQVPAKAEGTTIVVPISDVGQLAPSERQVYKLNKRVQTQNRLVDDFPVFIREGFNVKIIADNFNTSPEGLIYSVIQEGKGLPAKEGQQVVFDYVGYNESGSLIDSSYRQGKPAEATLGIGGVIPGFEIALKSMPPGSKWRVIIPPELGPPVGPSTFFSAKQCEVFDISVLDIKNCSRKPMLMFSQLVCE